MRPANLLLLCAASGLLSTPPRRLCRRTAARRNAASTAAPSDRSAFRIASAASVAAWSACAVTALSKHPTLMLPAAHARLSILQALTPLPLLMASFEAAPEDRTIALGLAAASAWLCAAVLLAPHFTATAAARASGLAHMAHSAAITYPAPLRVAAATAHAGAALLCGSAYASAAPTTKRGAPSRLWLAVACAFGGWALIAAAAPFPLATLPTMLGRRLSRAFGAFSLLYAAAALALATTENDMLRRGVARGATAHWVAVAAKLVVERACLREFYPAAFSRPVASLGALATFAMALLLGARTPRRAA